MPLYEFNNLKPAVGKGTWIAPSAEIIGNVTIGTNCYIGFGAVIRGDFGKISIGNETSVEDNVVIHCAANTSIGNRVIIGHLAMIHDTVIHDHALIGMKSMICDHSDIGEWSIVAEQSMVKKKEQIPPGKIYAGSPAKEIGDVSQQHREMLKMGQEAHIQLVSQYQSTFKKV
jgi:phenylacetic acid degradation protein